MYLQPISRVMAYNGRIVSIRPKTTLRIDGNYNESRWFTAWDPTIPPEAFPLPDFIADMQGTSMVPFGSALLSTSGACVGAITSDELIGLEDLLPTALSSTSADILTVSAANHFSVGNFDSLVSSLQNVSKDIGGVILYSNQHGCDGD